MSCENVNKLSNFLSGEYQHLFHLIYPSKTDHRNLWHLWQFVAVLNVPILKSCIHASSFTVGFVCIFRRDIRQQCVYSKMTYVHRQQSVPCQIFCFTDMSGFWYFHCRCMFINKNFDSNSINVVAHIYLVCIQK